MKNVLAFALVLGISSVASAAMVFDVQVNGQPWQGGDVKYSDVITVRLISDTDGAPFAGGGFGDYTVDVSDGDLQEAALGADAAVLSIVPSATPTQRTRGFSVLFTGSNFGATVPAGEYGLIVFHVPDLPNSSYIDVANTLGSWNGSFDDRPAVRLHVIPEPMTLSLLGLGGLGLLRRRRA